MFKLLVLHLLHEVIVYVVVLPDVILGTCAQAFVDHGLEDLLHFGGYFEADIGIEGLDVFAVQHVLFLLLGVLLLELLVALVVEEAELAEEVVLVLLGQLLASFSLLGELLEDFLDVELGRLLGVLFNHALAVLGGGRVRGGLLLVGVLDHGGLRPGPVEEVLVLVELRVVELLVHLLVELVHQGLLLLARLLLPLPVHLVQDPPDLRALSDVPLVLRPHLLVRPVHRVLQRDQLVRHPQHRVLVAAILSHVRLDPLAELLAVDYQLHVVALLPDQAQHLKCYQHVLQATIKLQDLPSVYVI